MKHSFLFGNLSVILKSPNGSHCAGFSTAAYCDCVFCEQEWCSHHPLTFTCEVRSFVFQFLGSNTVIQPEMDNILRLTTN